MFPAALLGELRPIDSMSILGDSDGDQPVQ